MLESFSSSTIDYALLTSISIAQLIKTAQKLSTFPCCTLSSIMQWHHLDYKMLDQRVAKRRDSGTLTCQMVVPLLLLSRHWAATEGSLEAQTYAIEHAWSAVQLVASKHSSEAKHRKWQNTCRHKSGVICFTVCTCVFWKATVVSFSDLHYSLNIESGEREISSPSGWRSVHIQEHTTNLVCVS